MNGKLTFVALVLMITSACARKSVTECPVTLEQAQAVATTEVQEAAIAWTLDSGGDWGQIAWLFIFVNDRQDPSEAALAHLRVHYKRLAERIVPISLSESAREGEIHHRTNGRPGRELGATHLEWLSPKRAEVVAEQWGCGDLCGGGAKLTIECTPEGWKVVTVGPQFTA